MTVSIPGRCELGGWHKKQIRGTEPLPDWFWKGRAAKGIHGFHVTYLDSVTFTIFTGQFGPCRWVENEFSTLLLFEKLCKDDYCKILVLDRCSLFYPRWMRCSIFFHGALLVHCCTVNLNANSLYPVAVLKFCCLYCHNCMLKYYMELSETWCSMRSSFLLCWMHG